MRYTGFIALTALVTTGPVTAQYAGPQPTRSEAVAVVLRVVPAPEPLPGDTLAVKSAEPTSIGVLLRPGDRVIPPVGGHLLVLHAGGATERIVESRRIEDSDADATGLFRIVRAQLRQAVSSTEERATAGDRPADLPVRPTGERWVRSMTPTLHWRSGDGLARYRIHLWLPEGRIVTADIEGDTSWTLPADQALTPGMAYEWAVEPLPGGRVSARATFRIASREVLDEVARELGRLRAAGLDPGGDGLLAAAIVFRALGLPYDAAEALQQLTARAEPWSEELTAFERRLATELEQRGEDDAEPSR